MSLLLRHLALLRPDRAAELLHWPALTRQRAWTPDVGHLTAFSAICPGWKQSGYLPPTYPQVVAADLHLDLLADRQFPWLPLGMVHLSQTITQQQPLPVERAYLLRAKLLPDAVHPKGYVVRFSTTLSDPDSEALYWQSETRALMMRRHALVPDAAPELVSLPADSGDDTPHWQASLPEDLGRRYARIAGDMNPIHQSAWMARPFGFKKPIIHGMWSLGWAVHHCVGDEPEYPMHIVAAFKRPVYLPGSLYGRRVTSARGMGVLLWTDDADAPAMHVEIMFEPN